MKERLLATAHKYWADFRGFSAGQKAVTIVALAALVVGGVLFTTWKSSPPYAPLYSNLAPSDASAIVDKLNSSGVPYRLAAAGTQITVPQDKVYATRLAVSAAGLPSSSQSGYSLLDKEGITTSEYKQHIDYQRAVEGELAKTIESMAGVQTASVHLAIPQDTVFNDGTQKTTAAVMLSLATGTQLTTQQVQSIVYLVSSSVPNLSSDDVTVADAQGRLLATPGGGITGTVGSDTRTQAEEDYDNRLATKLQDLLTPVIGAGHAVVTVNADLNFDKTSTTKQTYTYDPKAPPISEQTTSEKYTGNQSGGGTFGSGAAASTTAGPSGNGSYNKTTQTRDNALGTVTEKIDSTPGGVAKQSIGVLLDSSVKTANVQQISSLLTSAAGVNTTRGDTISIQAMPFDQSAAKAAQASDAAAAKAAAAKAAQARMMSLIKQAAFGVLLVAILVGTWLAGRRRRTTPEPPVAQPWAVPPVADPPAPQPAAAQAAAAEELRQAASRRQTLVQLAEEQPSDVAGVLSGWLNSRDSEMGNDRAPRNPWAAPLAGTKGEA